MRAGSIETLEVMLLAYESALTDTQYLELL